MKKTKHTPLPWGIHHGDDYSAILNTPESSTSEFIANIYSDDIGYTYEDDVVNRQANADFILKACNSHYELIEALNAIVRTQADSDSESVLAYELAEIAEKALKKAKGLIK